MSNLIRSLVPVLLLALILSPTSARAVEFGRGTVTVQGDPTSLVVPYPGSIQLSVYFWLFPSAVPFDGVVVGPDDVGRTFRVTREMDPVAFDVVTEQLMNGDPWNVIAFRVSRQGAPEFVPVFERAVTDAELFPPHGDFFRGWLYLGEPPRMITALTLRVDHLEWTDTFFGRLLSGVTLTLGVEGTASGAGIALSAESVPESAVPVGEGFAHILTVRNDDVQAAGAVELTFGPDFYSSQVDGITPSQGTCGPWPGYVGYICDLGSLPSGAAATVRIDQSAASAGYYRTNATAVDRLPPAPIPGIPPPPPPPPGVPLPPPPSMPPLWEPRLASVMTRVVSPVSVDLSITKFGWQVSPGRIDYTLRIDNPGPAPATGVRVTESLPEGEGLLFGQGFTPTGPWRCGPSHPVPQLATEAVCETGSLPAGGMAFLNYSRQLSELAPVPTIVRNRVTVTSLEHDPNPGNNVAIADVMVSAPTDLAAEVIGPAGPTTPGTPITYTLRVTNLGWNPATSILLVHPADPSVRSAGGPGWTCPPVLVPPECTRESLGVGESADVTVTVAPLGGLLQIEGSVRASNLDPNFGNNQWHVTIPLVAPPVAFAGADQTVSEGALVTLDGTASTGEALSFAWDQTAGTFGAPPVLLSDVISPTPTFTAPTLVGGFGSQVLTFRLTVGSFNMTATDTVNVTVKNVNHAPVAAAGPDQVVREGGAVTLDAGASYDPDGDGLTFSWQQMAGPPVTLYNSATAAPTFTAPLLPGGLNGEQTFVFRVTVRDGTGESALSHFADVQVKVEQENHAPVAAAGDPQTRNEGAVVTLNGTGSGDPDGDPITYSWTQVAGAPVTLSDASSATPSFTAPPAAGPPLTFRLAVSDGGLTSSAQVVITVVNVNDPPRCDLAKADPRVLWPPDHKLLPVAIVGVSDPDSDRVAITITAVTQDEPVQGPDDADTSPDAVVQDGGVHLRAERAGGRNGRVYRVAFTADDGLTIGGSCQGAVTVGVPPSMQAGMEAIDDGQLYDATRP